jgi:hypothetical protein
MRTELATVKWTLISSNPHPPVDMEDMMERVQNEIFQDNQSLSDTQHINPDVIHHLSDNFDQIKTQNPNKENIPTAQPADMETVHEGCFTGSESTDTDEDMEEKNPLANRKTRISQTVKDGKKKRNRRTVDKMEDQHDTTTDHHETGSDTPSTLL